MYEPSDDANVEIAKAVKMAASQGKHVLLQIGGNWCGWCILFDREVNSNDTLRIAMEKNFVVLDSEGNRLHTQNSVYLEEGKAYNTKKILDFLNHWSLTAIDPKEYGD